MSKNLETSGFMELISGVQGGEFEYVDDMPIDDCYPDPEQPRYKSLTAEGVADITATFSVTKGRIWQPIVVRERDDEGHKVLMGGRRWLAVKLYSVETIPVLIVQKDIDSALFLQLMENIARRPLDIREEGASYITLKEEGKSQKEIAFSLGKSEAYIAEAIMMSEMETNDKLAFINQLYEDDICKDTSTLAVLVRMGRKDAAKTEKLIKWAISNECLNRKWAKSLSVKDIELPIEEQLAALDDAIEERRAYEKTPQTKTAVPSGMTDTDKSETDKSETDKSETDKSETDKSETDKSETDKSETDKSEEFSLEQEKDGIEEEANSTFKKKRVTEINVLYNAKVAKLLLDRTDNEEGFAWIVYDNSEEEFRVEVSELSLIFVG